jgi:single-strand DNA-binding protein
MLNKVILIGRMACDADLKWTPNSVAVATFRLAVERPQSTEAKQSGQEKQTDFFDIVAWRHSAEFASNYLGKGRLVAIDGRLQIRTYQAQDGTNRRVAEVVVEQIKSLDPKPKDQPPHPAEAENANQAHQAAQAPRGSYPQQHANSAPAAAPPITYGTGAPTDLDDPFADE